MGNCDVCANILSLKNYIEIIISFLTFTEEDTQPYSYTVTTRKSIGNNLHTKTLIEDIPNRFLTNIDKQADEMYRLIKDMTERQDVTNASKQNNLWNGSAERKIFKPVQRM